MNRLNNTILSAAALGLLALLAASCIKTIPVSSLSVSQTSLTLVEGEEAHLTVTVSPADATDPSVVWRSSDPAVATVPSPPAPQRSPWRRWTVSKQRPVPSR